MTLNPEGPEPIELHSKTVNRALRRGDVFSMFTQGGGGFGPAAERDAGAVVRDLREGKVSAGAADTADRQSGSEK